MASKAIHPIIQRLIDLIEPTEDGRQAGPTSAFGHARNKGTNPHGGFDINRGKDVPGSVASPVYGKIGTVVRGGLGTIVIHEVDPVTKQPTGYDIEILHTQAQNVKPGDPVKPGQSIGVQGGVGVDGVGKPPGASHAHIQVYKGSDPTPLNPLRHLYEYHYPGQPILPLPELEPYSVPPRHAARANPDSEHDPVLAPPSPDAPPGNPEPAAPNTQPPTLPPSQFSPRQPAPQPPSSIGPPLELRRRGLRAPPTPVGKIVPGSTGATGQLYFNPPSSPRQFGPFTLPGADNSPMDILAPRDGNPGGSSIPIVATPGQFGSDGGSPPSAVPQPINGNAANQTGGNDIGGVWTTAQQYMSGQPARMQPAAAPSDGAPGAFPENGAAPIGYLNGANQTGTFDPAASFVPRPRPRPPQAPAAWPSSPIAPLQQMPQAEPAAPWHPDGHDAGDGPRQNLPNWAQLQPPTENTFPVSALNTTQDRLYIYKASQLSVYKFDRGLLYSVKGQYSLLSPDGSAISVPGDPIHVSGPDVLRQMRFLRAKRNAFFEGGNAYLDEDRSIDLYQYGNDGWQKQRSIAKPAGFYIHEISRCGSRILASLGNGENARFIALDEPSKGRADWLKNIGVRSLFGAFSDQVEFDGA
jgi:hypothetical protein